MQKELDRLRGDLELAKAQIESLHTKNLAKDSELQRAKAKLNQYNLRYERPESELIRKREQCWRAQKKCWEAINQWD